MSMAKEVLTVLTMMATKMNAVDSGRTAANLTNLEVFETVGIGLLTPLRVDLQLQAMA